MTDAQAFVETLGVKGGPGELLRIIATRIPPGQTTTPEIAIDDLAAQLGRHEQTVRRRRDALKRKGVIKVHGGHGVVARYELVGFDGVRPLTDAALPLVGAAPPRRARKRRARTDETTRDLFTDPPSWGERTVENSVHFARSGWAYSVHFARSGWLVLRSFCTELVNRTIKQRSTPCILHGVPPADALPLGVPIDPRARDVHTSKNVHTHTVPRDGPPDSNDDKPPPAPVHSWHAWCGLVCVPNKLHQPWLHKGHKAEWLFAFYARTCATLSAEEARDVVDEFKFWRTALAAELARARAPTSPPAASPEPPYDAVWQAILQRIEPKVKRHEFHKWFMPLVMVTDHPTSTGRVIEVTRQGSESPVFADWIQRHYTDVVAAAVDEVRPGTRVDVIDVFTERKFG